MIGNGVFWATPGPRPRGVERVSPASPGWFRDEEVIDCVF